MLNLDSKMNRADLAHLQSDLITTQLDIARLSAALSDGDDPSANFHPPADATAEQIALQRKFLIDQTTEHRTKLAALDEQKNQKMAEEQTIEASISKLRAVIDIAAQSVDIRKTLLEKQLTSKLLYLDSYQQLVQSQKEVFVQQSRRKSKPTRRLLRWRTLALRQSRNIGERCLANSTKPSGRPRNSPKT